MFITVKTSHAGPFSMLHISLKTYPTHYKQTLTPSSLIYEVEQPTPPSHMPQTTFQTTFSSDNLTLNYNHCQNYSPLLLILQRQHVPSLPLLLCLLLTLLFTVYHTINPYRILKNNTQTYSIIQKQTTI